MKIDVLDKGYIRLVDSMGDELSIVNAARVSYDKESTELSDKDIKLLNYLIENYHDSVLRHNTMTFEVYAPLLVARQWWKHHVSSTHVEDSNGWNESSRRYITENNEYYLPAYDEWRKSPENSKQGSSGPVSKELGVQLTRLMEKHTEKSEEIYKEALSCGLAPEQARLFLPAYSLYVRWRWTASLNALLNFLTLRLGSDAQVEITAYAHALSTMIDSKYPHVLQAWQKRAGQ